MKASDIDKHGYAVREGVLSPAQIVELIEFIETRLQSQRSRGGVRNLLEVTEMFALATSSTIANLVEPVLGPGFFPVRGILFDKTGTANWKVPWHQDMTIAVKERVEIEGFGPWSVKDGVAHVQPPAAILEEMLTVRLHLDDCPAANGALRVIAGSHNLGKVTERKAAAIAATSQAVTCELQAGGALLMHPLLLHSSSASTTPGHRRVLHFDFAASALPQGLCWSTTAWPRVESKGLTAR